MEKILIINKAESERFKGEKVRTLEEEMQIEYFEMTGKIEALPFGYAIGCIPTEIERANEMIGFLRGTNSLVNYKNR